MKSLIPARVESSFKQLLEPLAKWLGDKNTNPNWLTTLGFILSIFAAFEIANGRLVTGGVLVLLDGLFDIIDGAVARKTGRVTRFGAVYDSTIDRYSEVAVFFGLGFFLIGHHFYFTSVAAVFAIGGSIMVSYIRARAETLGFKANVGLARRQERVVILGFGLLLNIFDDWFDKIFSPLIADLFGSSFVHPPFAVAAATVLLAVLTNVTAIERLYYVYKQFKEENR
ncbi:MAG TPA: CDP-alcohol phosphatidyltransferase family protein [Candidatus Acidoferrales bacterium]|nr:CDP-alcohol phosphatidyltransferase family protein [Candidatus Acidoferrales bacterium]